jgi:hypothetical protein
VMVGASALVVGIVPGCGWGNDVWMGGWGDGFFWEQAFFPSAPRQPLFSTGQWVIFDWAWRGWGRARTMKEAGDAIAIGDGMPQPCFQFGHPNHSNSYVTFDRFFSFLSTSTMARGGKKIGGQIRTAAAPPLVLA